ncbi:hypothetical protein BJ085DRAFT_30494 [Dimargaris cristalligena]|uniref:Mif2 N-terminal domain-containing protein n=1 Tax=Dimargaris cristalligena TaxID=215637 RepID=A0A4Q0A313_9FUNG|nr:hypothetical protein BJ085DRAFT_30494 [Dimargaris cristalligena]|eukprot:RKP40477.1 hypothetical protein BJ085DRAFT_30494 [Dimargaris cristalligena]
MQPSNKASVWASNNPVEVGVRGRKTGIHISKPVAKDDDGLDNIDAFFRDATLPADPKSKKNPPAKPSAASRMPVQMTNPHQQVPRLVRDLSPAKPVRSSDPASPLNQSPAKVRSPCFASPDVLNAAVDSPPPAPSDTDSPAATGYDAASPESASNSPCPPPLPSLPPTVGTAKYVPSPIEDLAEAQAANMLDIKDLESVRKHIDFTTAFASPASKPARPSQPKEPSPTHPPVAQDSRRRTLSTFTHAKNLKLGRIKKPQIAPAKFAYSIKPTSDSTNPPPTVAHGSSRRQTSVTAAGRELGATRKPIDLYPETPAPIRRILGSLSPPKQSHISPTGTLSPADSGCDPTMAYDSPPPNPNTVPGCEPADILPSSITSKRPRTTSPDSPASQPVHAKKLIPSRSQYLSTTTQSALPGEPGTSADAPLPISSNKGYVLDYQTQNIGEKTLALSADPLVPTTTVQETKCLEETSAFHSGFLQIPPLGKRPTQEMPNNSMF